VTIRLIGDMSTADDYDRYLSTPTAPSITNPFTFWKSQQQMYPHLSSMALDILSIPAMSAGVERQFSQSKIMLTARRNRLHIDSLQAVECLKSWDKLQLSLPEIVVTGTWLEVVDEGDQLGGDQPEDEDMDLEIM
jgi:hypothetical protein